MSADLPLVSIVIPTYSRPDAAVQAIQTVRSQSYPHWEAIIVDDNPPESEARTLTRQHLSPLLSDQVHYIEHDENRGACAARNTGAEHASGSLIAFLDDDDLWAPQNLSVKSMRFYRMIQFVFVCAAFPKSIEAANASLDLIQVLIRFATIS